MASSPIEVVQAFIAAINSRDPSQLAALMSEDHTFVDSAGTACSGRELMTSGWADYYRMFPDYSIQIDTILGEKDVVAAFGRASGTYNGKRGLVPENRIEMPAAWRAIVQAGKIRHWQVYADWTEGVRIIDEDRQSGQRPHENGDERQHQDRR